MIELKASLNFYKIYEQSLLECDKQIEDKLISYIPPNVLAPQEEKMLKENSKKSRKHAPR